VKTVETASPSSLREMRDEIDSLQRSGIEHTTDDGATWSKTDLALDIRVPEGRQGDFSDLKLYGAQRGVDVYVRPY
jgi:hypothetical protein